MSYDNLFWGDVDTPNHSQWRIKAESLLADRDIWHPTATKYFPLGAIAESRDGRLWRYCEEAGNALSIAHITQAAAETANWTYTAQTNTPDVWVAGDKQVTVVSDTAFAAHDLIDGYMYVPDGTGEGNMYIIKDNKVSTSNATSGSDTLVDIADAGGIRTAIVAASDVTLWKNKYKDVIVFPTNPTGPATGVTMTAVTANYFFWAQVRGPCPVIMGATDTIVIGDMVGCGGTTAGQCCLMDIAAEGDTFLGYCMKAPVAQSDYAVIDLKLE
jgi:hypothetical protein